MSAPRHLLILYLAGAMVILSGYSHQAIGQVMPGSLTGPSFNQLHTSVPFLTIAPDGRASGMGDAGAASAPDLNAQHWNAAKYVFLEGQGGISLTYTPWIPALFPDIALIYTAGSFRINDKNAISGSFRYFDLGTDGLGYHPQEWALDVGYSRKITKGFSGGIVLRYIRSDLSDHSDVRPGVSFAGDLGLYYQQRFAIGEKNAIWALGLNLSNMGSPITYSPDIDGTPIPANFRAGGRFGMDLTNDHSLSFHLDLNKLMVPTPPVCSYDSLTGEMVVLRGKAAPESVFMGMVRSFYDAPGVLKESGEYSVFAEEIHEITMGMGVEYRFRNLLAVRSGYFHEHATKGNRKYFTFGLGTGYRFLSMDISYLLPVDHNAYLKNTFRITLRALI